MMQRLQGWQLLIFCGIVLGVTDKSSAAILGFGDFKQFSVNKNDTQSAPNLSPGQIEITSGDFGESRSVFALTPQATAGFTASFTYRATNVLADLGDGAAFVIQNSPSGAAAKGATFGDFGYSDITNSVALAFDLTSSEAGLFTGGNGGRGASPLGSINLVSGDAIDVALSYHANSLSVLLTDETTKQTSSLLYQIDIPAMVGGTTAFVGFTAGSPDPTSQFISNFTYTGIPEPSSIALLAIGGAAAIGLSRRFHKKQ
ncbi:MAG TPA: PEP-CTERM sorting domain-containing protein [Pirellulales bacterium]